jgi:hypothetical protein
MLMYPPRFTTARVLIAKCRARCFLRSSHAELQSRDPQPDPDVGGSVHDDPLEDGKRFDGSS